MFLNEFDVDDLELKNDLITYYGHVPVTSWYLCSEMKEKESEVIDPILKYFKTIVMGKILTKSVMNLE